MISLKKAHIYTRKSVAILLLTLGLLWLLVACDQSNNNQNNTQTAAPGATIAQTDSSPTSGVSQTDSYPAPGVSQTDSYPAPSQGVASNNGQAYPAVTDLPIATDKPRFQFANELTAGMTTLEGSAPPNLSLAVIDITFNGVVLGQGGSDNEGRFAISVTPLPEGHRVGIGLATLEEGKTYEQSVEELFPYRGDNFMNIPNVGVYFETAMVQP
ncbi:MAG: hypothetical protein KJ069_04995 [Anaerolineae bacterium]|nr:hypothetical protein [Anaerolineae bacterium]